MQLMRIFQPFVISQITMTWTPKTKSSMTYTCRIHSIRSIGCSANFKRLTQTQTQTRLVLESVINFKNDTLGTYENSSVVARFNDLSTF